MPCFNAGRMLDAAMWSVLAQSHPNVELIFIDNNSTDGSAERARELAAGQHRPFHFAHCAEQGSNNARNLGYSMARGDYIQWLDADDALGVDKLALQVDALENDRNAAVAYCDWMASRHYANGQRHDQVNLLKQVDDQILRTLSGIWYPTHSYLIRREAADILQAENGWPPERKIGTDVEYIGIAAMLGMRFRHVPTAKVQYNIWSSSQISGTGTPYDTRVAALSAVWRRLGEFAQRPEVAPRITAQHRILLDQDWNVWTAPPDTMELATLSARTHALRHVATGRTLELGTRDATIATVLLGLGLSRVICHHALQIAAGVAALREEHVAIVSALELFRREGFLTRAESSGGDPQVAVASARPAERMPVATSAPTETLRPTASRSTRDVVAKAWTEVLRGNGLTDNQRFDAAGGDSLALLTFALNCEARLGVPVSTDVLSPRMRPSDFVAALDRILAAEEADATTGPMVEADQPTIFLIRVRHHMDPSEAPLRHAAAGLARVVSIPFPPWPVLAREGFDFSTLVDHIVNEIDPRIGTGPVMLFGLCLGGMLAHAVAARLIASGKQVGCVFIMDGDADWALDGLPANLRDQGMASREQQFSGAAAIVAKWLLARPRLVHWVGETGLMRRLPRKFAAHLNLRLNSDMPGHFDQGGLARLLSDGGCLGAPVVLLRSLDQAPGAPADLNWRRLCARVTVVPILGSHYHLFAPENVPVLLLALTHAVRLGLAASGLSPAPRMPPAGSTPEAQPVEVEASARSPAGRQGTLVHTALVSSDRDA
jgi:thioesterase domain-containing protein/GT2 family glycosyltransferase